MASNLSDRRSRCADRSEPRSRDQATIRKALASRAGGKSLSNAGGQRLYGADQVKNFLKIEGQQARKEYSKTKSLTTEYFRVGSVEVSCSYEVGDAERASKIEALKTALKKINDLGFRLPESIDVVISAQDGVRNVAFMGDVNGGEKIQVFLGPKIFQEYKPNLGPKGVADGFRKQQKATAVIIHELGHVLHMRTSPNLFWSGKDPSSASGKAPPDSAAQLSQYACQNKLEFVADAFTAIVMTGNVNRAVFEDYKSHGGPTTARLDGM
ncbi:MAG: hypothetical protein GXY25_17280 [Pirellulaceae bacterium]|jgi:hypothetical protein|nr:hypothetical protein [Thermoguttaceae bacterium]NLZ02272.1 hypothetical protein [Pirellulaceae bacterium]